MQNLIKLYGNLDIEFDHLKPVTLAMWLLESGRGSSELAQIHQNYSGLKWRNELRQFANPVLYQAHDGSEDYCKFASDIHFIFGFWAFIDRSPYNGWRDKVLNPIEWLTHIYQSGFSEDSLYVHKVASLIAEAESLLGMDTLPTTGNCCGVGTEMQKPAVDRTILTQNSSSRNGQIISSIVLHYTTSRNINGTISWFLKPVSEASTHYIIGVDGELVQMVSDDQRAWHAGKKTNRTSIGIEFVATKGDKVTEQQLNTALRLIRWLMFEYDIEQKDIFPHKWVKATSCCGDLFAEWGGAIDNSGSQEYEAIQLMLLEKLKTEGT